MKTVCGRIQWKRIDMRKWCNWTIEMALTGNNTHIEYNGWNDNGQSTKIGKIML